MCKCRVPAPRLEPGAPGQVTAALPASLAIKPRCGSGVRTRAEVAHTLRAVFTSESRSAFRDWLISEAGSDRRVTALAVLGSGADGGEDRWSDIDLALRLAPGEDPAAVADTWTEAVTERRDLVAQTDLWAAGALYRVFFFRDTLQVDLSFWPDDKFAAHGPRFRLVFGEANPAARPSEPEPQPMLGMGWLYAIHARSSIGRARTWQAVYMINGIRDCVVQLACLRHGLSTSQGRGVDDLPEALVTSLAATLPHSIDAPELRRTFSEVASLLATEAGYVDPDGAPRLAEALAQLVGSADPAFTGP